MKTILLPETHKYINTILSNYKGEDTIPILALRGLVDTIIKEERGIISKDSIQLNIIVKSSSDYDTTVLDKTFTVSEIENVLFFQPLDQLLEHEVDSIADILSSTKKDSGKRVIILPCMAKVLTAQMLIRDTKGE